MQIAPLIGFADHYLRTLPYWAVVLLALFGIAGIGVLDYRFGPEISLFIFYFLPVGIATWYGDGIAGASCALIADLPLLAELAGTNYFAGRPGVVVWTLLMQSGTMLVVVYLLARLRVLFEKEAALAREDVVTGILNRRGFFERLEFTMLLTQRQKLRFALACVDLDNFKAINDSCGHAEGDRVLRLAARIFKDSIRQSDVAARLGGDEFALLLHGLDRSKARRFIDDLQDEFRRVFEREQLSVTCSIGCVLCDSSAQDTNDVIKAADCLLYEVKRRGKNGVLIGDYSSHLSAQSHAPALDPDAAGNLRH